jgi:hypothetical protein
LKALTGNPFFVNASLISSSETEGLKKKKDSWPHTKLTSSAEYTIIKVATTYEYSEVRGLKIYLTQPV